MKKNILINLIVKAAATITFGTLFFILSYIIVKGLPHINLELFAKEYTSSNMSVVPSIVTTVIMVVLTLLIATPIGVFTGFYLIEYAQKGNRFVNLIRLTTETLSGIPSIVYGLFGMLFFVIALGFQYSIIAGVFTLSIMVLPLIIRSTEEALIAVDDTYRNGSFALGAGKLRTIFIVVLPIAMPGILSGVILSIGRIVGETAALMYTLGTSSKFPKGLGSSGRTLALHMFVLSHEGKNVNAAYATGLILIILILIINGVSTYLSNKLIGGKSND